MNILAWIYQNCKFAAFNAPQRGDRIELPNRPGDYYLVTDKPQVGKDPRGMPFWHARVKDNGGREQMLSSDRVPSWQHFKGNNYPWHDTDIQNTRFQQEQQQKAGQIQAFEEQYRFPDGQPLKRNAGRPMVITVKPDAQGQLSVFAGVRLYVRDIDYDNQTVKLEPLDAEFAEFAGHLAAVPAAEVIQDASPVMNPQILREPVTLPNGERIDAEQLMHMTPGLNRLARAGQVSLKAQVYVNYESGKGTGEELFMNDMMRRGIPQENVEMMTEFKRNPAAAKFDASGAKISPRGPWTGTVYIAAPIPEEVKREVTAVAPKSQVFENRDGSMMVISNPLYKQMVAFGVLDR